MAGKVDFLERIRICEGAMGTMLLREGAEVGDNSAELNLSDPSVVAAIHRQYARAGATCLITNTFSPKAASSEAEREHLAEIVAAGVRIGRRANSGLILGDVGPCGLVLEPLGDTAFNEAFDIYAEHIAALASEGPDAILLETFIDISDLRCAIFAARSVCDLPIIASCTFNTSRRMPLSGTTPAAAAVILDSLGVDVIGMNCGIGSKEALEIVKEMREHTDRPLIVQPNAGLPIVGEDGSTTYPATPYEMASYCCAFAALGATLIGTCCGSTPEFTASVAAALEGVKPVAFHKCEGILELSSISDCMRIDPGFFDQLDSDIMDAGGVIIECDELDDHYDVLEETSSCPVIFEFGESLEALETALRHYPGRAAVRNAHTSKQASEIARRYGAYEI
ncbi:MAG: homocysteine S-methyltransferase family protein [bacterium]|nr:homocysteine S-methyltransferase family protein [bacterium]